MNCSIGTLAATSDHYLVLTKGMPHYSIIVLLANLTVTKQAFRPHKPGGGKEYFNTIGMMVTEQMADCRLNPRLPNLKKKKLEHVV